MPIDSFTLPGAEARWILEGPAGYMLDALVAGLIGAGAVAECVTPTTRYRLRGPAKTLGTLADKLAELAPEYSLTVEQAPANVVRLTSHLAPRAPYRRSVVVHGAKEASTYVVRALDRKLLASTCGHQRWTVTGRTDALALWIANVYGTTQAAAFAMFGLTPEAAAAEDADAPVVQVVLPDRRITTEIGRNQQGDIVTVVQREVTP